MPCQKRRKRPTPSRPSASPPWGCRPPSRVFSSRWGATIAIIAVPILIGLGILSVNWVNGMPQFSFNRDRAVEVGREVETRAIKAAQLIEQQRQQQQSSQWR